MKVLPLIEEFRAFCKLIARDAAAGRVWVENEDEYQSEHFCGGWTCNERNEYRFAMSFYAPDGIDYLFAFTINDAVRIAAGETINLPLQLWKPSNYGSYDPSEIGVKW